MDIATVLRSIANTVSSGQTERDLVTSGAPAVGHPLVILAASGSPTRQENQDMTTRPSTVFANAIVVSSDFAQSRAFYEDVLGLDGWKMPGDGWAIGADGGSRFFLLPGEPGPSSWEHPGLNLTIPDFDAAIRTYRERGVAFLGRDDVPLELDDDDVYDQGTGLRFAWFRDPDGCVINVCSVPE